MNHKSLNIEHFRPDLGDQEVTWHNIGSGRQVVSRVTSSVFWLRHVNNGFGAHAFKLRKIESDPAQEIEGQIASFVAT